MNGGRRNDEEEEGGGGWASTFLKVAGVAAATAAVAGSLYSLLNQPEVAPLQVRRTDHHEEVFILKVDGSLLPGSRAGCGGYLSSASKKWICGFAQKLVPTSTLTVDQTEKEAILRGLRWVKEKVKRKVEVKSDNEGVVYSVNCGGKTNDDLISDIRGLLHSPPWKATLTWIPGGENEVADRLAHKAHKLTSFRLCEFDDAPENCVAGKAGVAVATVAVAGSLYCLLKQPGKAEVAPLQARRTDHHEEVFILNVDGSFLHDIPSASCGGYLSSASEKWICGFAQKLDPTLTSAVDQTEKEAILSGLRWVKKKGKRKVEVKSDSESVVKSVNRRGKTKDHLIIDIRGLLDSPHWEATLTLIPRDENKVADRLARKAHKLTSFVLYEFDYAPENCLSLL